MVSPEVLDEYRRVAEELTGKRPNLDFERLLVTLVSSSLLVQAYELAEPVCDDPDDDKFIACALAGDAKVIASGDRHLLAVSGYRGIKVLRPREYVDQYLT